MWHLINNLRQKLLLRQNKVKIIFVLILLTAILLPLPVLASEQNVNMSVQVLPRKITDTINDFDFSSLGIDNQEKVAQKQVKGVSTEKHTSSFFSGLFAKITGFFRRTF